MQRYGCYHRGMATTRACDTRLHKLSEAKAFRQVSNACSQFFSASLVTVGWKAKDTVQEPLSGRNAPGYETNDRLIGLFADAVSNKTVVTYQEARVWTV